jgi:hypothetical protein
MEITNVTKQAEQLANILRQALGEAGYSYENMTFAAALVVSRAAKQIETEAQGHAWQNDAKMTPAEAAIYAAARS